MTADRTVTVPTLVTNIVDVTVPEPAWCIGHDDLPPNALVDLVHRGIEHHLGTADYQVLIAQLTQYPHGSGPSVDLYVESAGESASLDPEGIKDLAVACIEAAVQLRQLALQVAALRAEEASR